MQQLPSGIFALAMLALSAAANAQEYSRFLSCKGNFIADEKTHEANAEIALRVNNRTALIQGSNVLPVGEILRYVPTPVSYSMTYILRPKGTKVIVVPGWFQNTILVAYPNLNRLNQIRLSVNRQTGVLDGKLLNEEDELLGSFSMNCSSQTEQDVAAPKF
ncbi:hypothetical protein LNV09_04355 [Paucibacter sp. B2R-40]|uniref:hypothetical protein n=1 Tax=Paucibacter sp. B2R-40 TaxID=2893554 RepID=UPI0021E4E1A5|nr:hypothetical protein [Paucibacter sp. B2R-40]MCV2353387.1 hypothetical protein [Paucibacter sp. B2R-40]